MTENLWDEMDNPPEIAEMQADIARLTAERDAAMRDRDTWAVGEGALLWLSERKVEDEHS